MPHMYYTTLTETPLGSLAIIGTESAVSAILHAPSPETLAGEMASFLETHADLTITPDHSLMAAAAQEVKEYLARKRTSFSVRTQPIGGTTFQRRVWAQLQTIPRGETVSYQQLAKEIGEPDAVRAVGSACGANPLPLMIPCHRVLRTDGTLGGFAWGLDSKIYLLGLEGVELSAGAMAPANSEEVA